MHEHQTFSLTTLLNTHHLQPAVYQHMIHEIKSPLQQQSFDLTCDNSASFENIPKRPNIPPAPKSPLAQDQQFSKTYQSLFIDVPQSKYKPQPEHDYQDDHVVSPLQYEINQHSSRSYGPAAWCGNHLDQIFRVEEGQIQLSPSVKKSLKRRPIFQKIDPRESCKSPKVTKTYKPIEDAINTLIDKGEPELASFLELLGALYKQMNQMSEQKNQMEQDLGLIYERLSTQTSYTSHAADTHSSQARILQRLRSRNAGEVIKKLFKRQKSHQDDGQRHLQKIFSRLSRIQVLLCNFIERQNALAYMSTVYDYLSTNFSSQSSLSNQLTRLFNSLGVQLETDGLELIWQGMSLRKLSKAEFIQGLSLNSFVVREQSQFQEELQMKGFRRNDAT